MLLYIPNSVWGEGRGLGEVGGEALLANTAMSKLSSGGSEAERSQCTGCVCDKGWDRVMCFSTLPNSVCVGEGGGGTLGNHRCGQAQLWRQRSQAQSVHWL